MPCLQIPVLAVNNYWQTYAEEQGVQNIRWETICKEKVSYRPILPVVVAVHCKSATTTSFIPSGSTPTAARFLSICHVQNTVHIYMVVFSMLIGLFVLLFCDILVWPYSKTYVIICDRPRQCRNMYKNTVYDDVTGKAVERESPNTHANWSKCT